MRFKKGDRVEVMSHKGINVCWHTGEIVSGRDPTYRVQYYCYRGMSKEQIQETVPRQCLRPCPPLVLGRESCGPGDIVEVFHDYSWKLAAILTVPKVSVKFKSSRLRFSAANLRLQFVVRLLGSKEELKVGISNIRMRQIWRDGKWVLVEKNSEAYEDVLVSNPSNSNPHQNIKIAPYKARHNKAPQQDYSYFLGDAESPITSSRSLKRRSPFTPPYYEAHNCNFQKSRAVEIDGKVHRVTVTPRLEKVHAVACPNDDLGRKNKHASLKTISNGYNQLEGEKLSSYRASFAVRSPEICRSYSDGCSIGSCSTNDLRPNNHHNASGSIPCQETDTMSDAESSNGLAFHRKSISLSSEREVQHNIHRYELHAYRRTLQALYARGPLTWDREILLTNLRIMLNILDEEHLMELKLLSGKPVVFG